MIIRSLKATNFQKYESIQIEEIPQQGLIAVTGLNESGKSTIGEMICFALFGRSFSVDDHDLARLIRWNEDQAHVYLVFDGKDAKQYQLARGINDLGNQTVCLECPSEGLAINDAQKAKEKLDDVVGFNYAEFVESFYLAQREISTPNAHSDTVKNIAGITPYEQAKFKLLDENKQLDLHLSGLAARLNELHEQIDAATVSEQEQQDAESQLADAELALDSAKEKMVELSDRYQALKNQHAGVERAVQALMQVGVHASYLRWQEHIQALLTESGDLSFTLPESELGEEAFLALGRLREQMVDIEAHLASYERTCALLGERRMELAVLLGEPSAQMAGKEGESITVKLQEQERKTSQQVRMRDGFGFVAGLFLIFALLDASETFSMFGIPTAVHFLLAGLCAGLAAFSAHRIRQQRETLSTCQSQIEEAKKEADQIDQLDIVRLEDALDFLETYSDSQIKDAVHSFRQGDGLSLITESGIERMRDNLKTAERKLRELISQLDQATQDKKQATQVDIESLQLKKQNAEEAVEAINARHEKVEALNNEVVTLKHMMSSSNDSLNANERASKWFDDMIQYVSERFNRNVKKLAGVILPSLTQDRYQFVQLDEQLDVRVFSSEKQDFVDIDELSSGTQRQIMLALRLALCQELIKTTGQRNQFVFLDEPFAFFDAERTKNSLQAMPNLTNELAQIWVVAQEFPSLEYFNKHIECQRDQSSLLV